MTDRDLLELIARQVAKLTEDVGELKVGQKNLELGQQNLEVGQQNLEVGQQNLEMGLKGLEARQQNLEMMIEHDIKSKIDVLFDGHEQTRQQLNRIEKEVSRHEEIILRRIR